MKKEFSARPETISKEFLKNSGGFPWQEFVLGFPALVFLVTGWKKNGKENACLQSWAAFGGSGDEYICVMPSHKGGHMYKSLKKTGVCVLNFPSRDVFDRCIKTIGNNQYETDEITAAGLTAEKASVVDAPRIKECFLNIECEFLWEHKGLVAVKAVNICMDSDRYDHNKLGRYGKTGLLYQIHCPTNPETGEIAPSGPGIIEQGDEIAWNTK